MVWVGNTRINSCLGFRNHEKMKGENKLKDHSTMKRYDYLAQKSSFLGGFWFFVFRGKCWDLLTSTQTATNRMASYFGYLCKSWGDLKEHVRNKNRGHVFPRLTAFCLQMVACSSVWIETATEGFVFMYLNLIICAFVEVFTPTVRRFTGNTWKSLIESDNEGITLVEPPLNFP